MKNYLVTTQVDIDDHVTMMLAIQDQIAATAKTQREFRKYWNRSNPFWSEKLKSLARLYRAVHNPRYVYS